MRILITGGAGFIGSHIVDLLVLNNHKVIIIDNLSTGKEDNLNPKARFFQEDLRNYSKIQEIFEKESPEIVYHLAAQIDVRNSIQNPLNDAEINILSTINLLELCVKNNVKHFIFSSTGGAIYGDTKNIPTTEEEREFPLSPYGCAKLSVEKYLNLYNKVYGLKYTVLRYANVYGPRQNPHGEAGVVAIFLNNMFANKSPVIFGGTQKRDFVYVEDVAKANLLALNDNKNGIYNVGTSKETDIIEIFARLNKYFNNKFTPIYQEMKKGEQKRSCIDYSKIKESLNWFPETELEEGFDKTYVWYLKQRNSQ